MHKLQSTVEEADETPVYDKIQFEARLCTLLCCSHVKSMGSAAKVGHEFFALETRFTYSKLVLLRDINRVSTNMIKQFKGQSQQLR